MTTPKIGLRISGTKQRRGGFQPLVAVGVLAGGEANNMDRVPLVAEKPAYVLKHTSDYALYMLIDRRVKSFDADAPGVLTIALTISSDSQLADKQSPFTLLQEIYDTFKSNYMTRLSDGRDSFIDKDAESGLFRQIIDRYSLEARPQPLIPMTQQCSTGILRVPKDKLEGFFRDTNYDEFKKFSDIEVGTECVCSPGLDELDIPKPPSYELWFNGERTGKFYRQKLGEDTLKIEKKGKPTVYITLTELMNAENQRMQLDDATIELDTKRNRILLRAQKQSVPARLAFRWNYDYESSKSEAISMIRNGRLKIKLGQRDISRFAVSEEDAEIDSENIDNLVATISPEYTPKYDFKVSKEITEYNDKKLLIINIKVTKKDANTDGVPMRRPVIKEEPVKPTPKSPKKAIIFTLCGLLLGLGAIFAVYKWTSEPEPEVAVKDQKNRSVDNGSEGGENPGDVDVANIESNQEDPEAGQKLIADARKNSAQNAENSKTKETGKNNENVGTTTASNPGPTMSKTQAIGILLGGQGDKTAARNALSQQERNDIEAIRALNNQSNEAKQIISQLRAGSLSIAAAKTKMQKLKPGGGNGGNGGNGGDGGNGGGTMSKTTAIRILLGENLGKKNDAEKVLGAEAKTVKSIIGIYNKLPLPRKKEADTNAMGPLKSGAITPSQALQKITNIRDAN